MNIWQRKLLAFLHDPPNKPFNIREHGEIADSLIRAAGFDDPAAVRWFFDKVCDHTAAAADRLAFPKSLKCEFTGGPESPFHHPLGGGKLKFEQPLTPLQAEDLISKAQPGYIEATRAIWSDEDQLWRARFFLHWRLWRQFATLGTGGQQGEGRLAYLPADTRIPDHSTWNHCGLVSALQSCVEIQGGGESAEVRSFQPAFLLVQIGPVQEFIAQARTTRDLWSGSYLLSWLIAHGIKAVTDKLGPDCVLFPSLWGQPLFDLLHRDELFRRIRTSEKGDLWEEIKPSDEQILTPNLPNRFLALVPGTEEAKLLGEDAAKAMRDELQKIGNACLTWLDGKNRVVEPDARIRWDQQLRQFLSVTWQTWPWETNVAKAIRNLAALPAGGTKNETGRAVHESLQAAFDAARKGIPPEELDPRNYEHTNRRHNGAFQAEVHRDAEQLPKVSNLGFAWASHYAHTDFLLAARRQTRDFEAWGDPQDNTRQRGASRDQLSGKEEIIGTVDWQEGLAKVPGHLFKPGELLGAPSIVKRLWHVAFLEAEPWKLQRKRVRFDSVPAVAAAPFVAKVLEKTEQGPARRIFTDEFGPRASEAAEFFGGIAEWQECDEAQWLDRTDASVFHLTEWDCALREEEKRPGGKRENAVKRLRAAREALVRLLSREGLNQQPSTYYAVLALDGDEMGKWVSGAKSPRFREQLAGPAVERFDQPQAGASAPNALQELLDHPRHLSPSYHLQFSEALSNFSVHIAPAVVEFFDGQLIYAGGDDVLAMLPAANAVSCAEALRLAFRGEAAVLNHLRKQAGSDDIPFLTAEGGFVALNAKWSGFTRNPGFGRQPRFLPRGVSLLVPGLRATVSAGIAIGHMKEPLQDMIREAQAAEKRAKAPAEREVWEEKEKRKIWKISTGWDRDALAVTLFKRSGETVQWGSKFGSPAFSVLDLFSQFFRVQLDQPDAPRPISGKFPYRLAELLGRYDLNKPLIIDPQLRDIVAKEIAWVIQRQTWSNKEAEDRGSKFRREDLETKCLEYLDHLCKFTWKRPAQNDGKETHIAARSLGEFINLFALEAFMARSGE